MLAPLIRPSCHRSTDTYTCKLCHPERFEPTFAQVARISTFFKNFVVSSLYKEWQLKMYPICPLQSSHCLFRRILAAIRLNSSTSRHRAYLGETHPFFPPGQTSLVLHNPSFKFKVSLRSNSNHVGNNLPPPLAPPTTEEFYLQSLHTWLPTPSQDPSLLL